jgi:hypothetical protein
MQPTRSEDRPPDIAAAVAANEAVVMNYLGALGYIVMQSSRDPTYRDNDVLSYLAQDLLQSAMAVIVLPREGMPNAAKRELRFLLEASVKLAYVQQEGSGTTVLEKLERFDKELSSSKISIKKTLNLALLPEAFREAFREEVGRLFSLTSAYVHLSPMQIQASIEAAEAGITAGKERVSDIEALKAITERVLAASLVLMLNSMPYWVAGDWLVGEDGRSPDWHFTRSRFIAAMDSEFDYKHERQADLYAIQAERQARIDF